MTEKNKRKPTIADVAKLAGISPATASRVLSGSGYPVKKEVQQKILQAASDLNYKPNIIGQMLRGGVSKEIGVIIPSLTNPFYAQLVSAVENVCIKRGYMPIICSSQNKYQLETMHLDMLQKKQVAGFLLSSIHLDSAFLKTLHGIPMPFVLFDQPYGYEKTDSVTFDFFEAGYMATRFLFDAGHKDIVFASGPLDRHSRKQLFEGYKKALKEKHIRFSSQNLVMASSAEICDGNCEDGFHCGQCIGDLLMSREYLPDAVFAVNDMVAIGIIKALEKQGIRIPADVSVIGCDNIPFGEMLVPALTTVNQSAVETGQLATDILLGRIENKQVDNNHIILHPKLIERETVRKINYKVRR